MVQTLNINKTYRRILSYLAKGDPTPFILQNTGLKKNNYYKKLKLLEKYGYITRKRMGNTYNIELQPKAIKELGIVSTGVQRVNCKEYINLHDVWVACQIIRKPDDWGKKDFVEKILEARGIDYTPNKVNNWKGIYFDVASVLVRVTPNKVMFNPPQIDLDMNDSPEHAKNIMLKYVLGLIPKIENWFRVTLSRPDRISMSISSQHIAFVNDKIAQYFRDNDIELKIYDEEGRLIVTVDKSPVPISLEFPNKAHAEENAENMKRLIHDTVTGQFDSRQITQDIAKIVDLMGKQQGMIGDVTANQVIFDNNIKKHQEILEEIGEGVRELTKAVQGVNNIPPEEKPYSKEAYKRYFGKG